MSTITDRLFSAFAKGRFLLPKQVVVHGSIEATIPGRIDGQVKGNVKTEGELVIGPEGSVKGNVHATDLVLYGKIYGDIHISNKAVLSNEAYVKGDVNALVLEVKEGARIEGAIHKQVSSRLEQEVIAAEESEPEPEKAPAPPPPDEERATTWF
ncbi:polymer-forming cytoskeletal protein [Chitinophaga agrisoli]|uniref:Polymer-forming cytoskeletal protein n=1 Tax=Chitinophaga agrisoli TaxID=2607653 RepID=A0A5B2VIT0_9BACT|nr:polymer-forming cytoskeletal protein [Chitinophaga agrisoli]KAA2238456.1 polymer-forming cytoskeletal protein [Chitinophaga agrisoli]